ALGGAPRRRARRRPEGSGALPARARDRFRHGQDGRRPPRAASAAAHADRKERGRRRAAGRVRRNEPTVMKEPSFTVGVEEEYLLVDRKTRGLVEKMPAPMLEQCAARIEGQQVKPEFMRSQIEIGTRICRT